MASFAPNEHRRSFMVSMTGNRLIVITSKSLWRGNDRIVSGKALLAREEILSRFRSEVNPIFLRNDPGRVNPSARTRSSSE